MFSTSVLKTSSHPEYLATTSHRRTSVASTPNRDYPSLRLISSIHEEDYSPQESKTVWQTGTPLCYDPPHGLRSQAGPRESERARHHLHLPLQLPHPARRQECRNRSQLRALDFCAETPPSSRRAHCRPSLHRSHSCLSCSFRSSPSSVAPRHGSLQLSQIRQETHHCRPAQRRRSRRRSWRGSRD